MAPENLVIQALPYGISVRYDQASPNSVTVAQHSEFGKLAELITIHRTSMIQHFLLFLIEAFPSARATLQIHQGEHKSYFQSLMKNSKIVRSSCRESSQDFLRKTCTIVSGEYELGESFIYKEEGSLIVSPPRAVSRIEELVKKSPGLWIQVLYQRNTVHLN